jgi:hypothetical protein
MKLSDRRSIVGIDPTTRGLAFVFFENGELLDWGERLRTRSDDELAIVDALLSACAADILVLEDPDAAGCKRHPRIRHLLGAIAKQTRRRGLTVALVPRAVVRSAWAARGATNKQRVAAEIASRLGELSAVVPPARKTGANEDPRVNVFDAASLVLQYDETFRNDFLR